MDIPDESVDPTISLRRTHRDLTLVHMSIIDGVPRCDDVGQSILPVYFGRVRRRHLNKLSV